MKRGEPGIITIGELAKKVGVSVRTLQFYDKSGLLRASLSEGGRRVYSWEDVMALQQILFLKSFNFSLDDIGGILHGKKSPDDFERIFTRQREMITEQMEQMGQIVKLLDSVITEVKAGVQVSVDHLLAIMTLMHQKNPYTFIVRYFGDEQLKNLSERFKTLSEAEGYQKKAEKLFARLGELYQNNADPAGEEGQTFAAQWWSMVNEFTAGDQNLLGPLLSAGMDIDNWPEEAREIQTAISNFLKLALDVYFEKNHIQLPEIQEGPNE